MTPLQRGGAVLRAGAGAGGPAAGDPGRGGGGRGESALRADAGYFAGDWPAPPTTAGMEFAIGAEPDHPPCGRRWPGSPDAALVGGTGDWICRTRRSPSSPCPTHPIATPGSTVLLIAAGVGLDPEQVSADPGAGQRLAPAPDQRALPIPELEAATAIYAYSFILTNRDVFSTARAMAWEALVPASHQHGEHLPRQQARCRAAPPVHGGYGEEVRFRLDVGVADHRGGRRLVFAGSTRLIGGGASWWKRRGSAAARR